MDTDRLNFRRLTFFTFEFYKRNILLQLAQKATAGRGHDTGLYKRSSYVEVCIVAHRVVVVRNETCGCSVPVEMLFKFYPSGSIPTPGA